MPDTAQVNLKLDLAENGVKVLIVENNVPVVPVLIGQEFLNRNKTLVARKDQVRVVNDEDVNLPELADLPQRKITLWAKDAVVIRPQQARFIEQVGAFHLHEHIVTRCLTSSVSSVVSIYNVKSIVYKSGQTVARSLPCIRECMRELT